MKRTNKQIVICYHYLCIDLHVYKKLKIKKIKNNKSGIVFIIFLCLCYNVWIYVSRAS